MKLPSLLRITLLSLLCLVPTSALFGQTLTFSGTAIEILDNAPANPYPSTTTASGFTSGFTISDVNITIRGLTHAFPDDVGLLLVGPTGVEVRLMTDSGGAASLSGATFTFDDSAATNVPDEGPIVDGSSYRPNQGIIFGFSSAHDANFPAPAPTGPYSNLLSSFNGTDPNGTWSLYVDDDTAIDGGSIDGWSITITAVPEPSTWMAGFLATAALGYGYARRRRVA